MKQLADRIREMILTQCLPGESPENLRNDTPLRSSGVLDSLATLSLITFVERESGIEIEAHETAVGHFDSIDDILALIERKRASM
jgi:acyl carrier protein